MDEAWGGAIPINSGACAARPPNERSRRSCVNLQVLEALAVIDKAQDPSEIDPSVTERLSKLTESEDKARAMITLGAKISTFALVRSKDDKPGGEPVALTLTEKQHDILVAEARQLAKGKSHDSSFVDDCADMLSSLLRKKLPTLKQ